MFLNIQAGQNPFELRICMYTDFDLKKKMVMSVWPENPKNIIFIFLKIYIISKIDILSYIIYNI